MNWSIHLNPLRQLPASNPPHPVLALEEGFVQPLLGNKLSGLPAVGLDKVVLLVRGQKLKQLVSKVAIEVKHQEADK